MNDPRRELDDLAARLRDGLLSTEERDRLVKQAATDAELANAVERDIQLDATLLRAFAPPAATFRGTKAGEARVELNARASGESHANEPSPVRLRRRAMWLTLAATVAWGFLGWQWFIRTKDREIAFVQRPLTEIYETCVAGGFQPYWICEDDAVFAETFRRRQGVSLELRDLPPGSSMAGLSYLAGLSRESTSMLAHVDGRPVIVFVDRVERDWRPPVGHDARTGLNVFRTERAGLALYEVTPLAEPHLLDSFQPRGDGK